MIWVTRCSRAQRRERIAALLGVPTTADRHWLARCTVAAVTGELHGATGWETPKFLTGRTAIVTGAAQGLGRGIALALGAAGADVTLFDRDDEGMREVVALLDERGARSLVVTGDVRELADLERGVDSTLAHFGGLGIVVNNAQMFALGNLLDVEEQAAEDSWRSGPLATWRLMRLAHPHLVGGNLPGGGVIVNISSGATLMHDSVYVGMYAAAKAAIVALTRAAAVEWGGDGIRALVVIPAARTTSLDEFERTRHARYEEMLTKIPLGRYGDPEVDIGRAVAWACGPDAGYLTGSTLMLDGGQMHLR